MRRSALRSVPRPTLTAATVAARSGMRASSRGAGLLGCSWARAWWPRGPRPAQRSRRSWRRCSRHERQGCGCSDARMVGAEGGLVANCSAFVPCHIRFVFVPINPRTLTSTHEPVKPALPAPRQASLPVAPHWLPPRPPAEPTNQLLRVAAPQVAVQVAQQVAQQPPVLQPLLVDQRRRRPGRGLLLLPRRAARPRFHPVGPAVAGPAALARRLLSSTPSSGLGRAAAAAGGCSPQGRPRHSHPQSEERSPGRRGSGTPAASGTAANSGGTARSGPSSRYSSALPPGQRAARTSGPEPAAAA